jgi:ABC-type Zn uptake system ZnuABC Zn-binding protein ZnuA
MEKKKIKKLIKEIKENKNPALMLNRALTEEEVKWLYEHTKPKHNE